MEGNGLLDGVILVLITVFLTLGVPATVKVIQKRRGVPRAAAAAEKENIRQLIEDRDLMFDWLLGPKGFDGKRRGGFMESDAQFKDDVRKALLEKPHD